MKTYSIIVLALACAALAGIVFVTKRGDNAQHENDAAAIVDFSNRLVSAQSQIAAGNETILTSSNRLDESQAGLLTFSNHLTEAESALALSAEQVTNLNRQLADLDAQNQTLGRQITGLTNQMASLAMQIALTQTNLARTNEDLILAQKSYALLETVCARTSPPESLRNGDLMTFSSYRRNCGN